MAERSGLKFDDFIKICEKFYIEEEMKLSQNKSSEFSAAKFRKFRKFCEKNFNKDEFESKKSEEIDLEAEQKKMESTMEKLNQMESMIENSLDKVWKFSDDMSYVCFVDTRPKKNNGKNKKQEYVDIEEEDEDPEVEEVRQKLINQEIFQDRPKISKTKKTDKSKSLIIKSTCPKQFLKRIRSYLKEFSMKSATLLDRYKIFVSFENQQDCKEFKLKLQKNFPEIKIYEEIDEDNIEVIIHNTQNTPLEHMEYKIENITGEKPRYISIVQKGENYEMHAGLTSLSFLKFQAHNECTIKVGGLECQYSLVPEQ